MVKNKKGQMVIDSGTVKHGPKAGSKGMLDTQGRIWIEDPAHSGYPAHFDVQVDAGKSYFRVGKDGGEVTKTE